MAGRTVGGWRDTDVSLVIPADQVAQMIEALALARVHVRDCLPLAPVNAAVRDGQIQACAEVLGMGLGAKLADRPNDAKWRELIPDHIRTYVVAVWRIGKEG